MDREIMIQHLCNDAQLCGLMTVEYANQIIDYFIDEPDPLGAAKAYILSHNEDNGGHGGNDDDQQGPANPPPQSQGPADPSLQGPGSGFPFNPQITQSQIMQSTAGLFHGYPSLPQNNFQQSGFGQNPAQHQGDVSQLGGFGQYPAQHQGDLSGFGQNPAQQQGGFGGFSQNSPGQNSLQNNMIVCANCGTTVDKENIGCCDGGELHPCCRNCIIASVNKVLEQGGNFCCAMPRKTKCYNEYSQSLFLKMLPPELFDRVRNNNNNTQFDPQSNPYGSVPEPIPKAKAAQTAGGSSAASFSPPSPSLQQSQAPAWIQQQQQQAQQQQQQAQLQQQQVQQQPAKRNLPESLELTSDKAQNRCLTDMCPVCGRPCRFVIIKGDQVHPDTKRVDCFRKCHKSFVFNAHTLKFEETGYESNQLPVKPPPRR